MVRGLVDARRAMHRIICLVWSVAAATSKMAKLLYIISWSIGFFLMLIMYLLAGTLYYIPNSNDGAEYFKNMIDREYRRPWFLYRRGQK